MFYQDSVADVLGLVKDRVDSPGEEPEGKKPKPKPAKPAVKDALADSKQVEADKTPKELTVVPPSKEKNDVVPLSERFDELLKHLRKFMKSPFAKVEGLRLVRVPSSIEEYEIRGQSDVDVWAVIRKGRGYHNVYKGSLLTKFMRDKNLRPFFAA